MSKYNRSDFEGVNNFRDSDMNFLLLKHLDCFTCKKFDDLLYKNFKGNFNSAAVIMITSHDN